MATTWSDQPAIVADLPVVGEFRMRVGRSDMHHVEVRRVHGSSEIYLTIGTLFGSQTVYCPTAGVALEVLCALGRNDRTLKNGARLEEQ